MKKISFLSLIVTLVLMLSQCSQVDDYMLGKDNSPKPSALVQIKPTLKMLPVWNKKLANGGNDGYMKLKLALDNNTLFAATSSGTVVALDSQKGVTKWQRATQAQLASGPSIGGSELSVGTVDARLMTLSTKTGEPLWQALLSNEILAPPVVADGSIYAVSVDGQLYAFDEKSGKRLWHYDHGSSNLVLRGGSSPQVAYGMVIVGFSDGKLDGLNAKTGQLIWQKNVVLASGGNDVERMVDIIADPIISNETVFVATYQGVVTAMSLRTGDFIWQHKMSTYNNMALGSRYLYVSDSDSQVWAFDRKNGNVIWRQGKLTGRKIGPPTLGDSALFVADASGYLHLLSPSDGHFLARIKIDDAPIYAAPIAHNKSVFILTSNGTISRYSVSS